MTANLTATGVERGASEVRQRLHRELSLSAQCLVDVGSEFEWKAVRRLARAVGRSHGMRVHSHLIRHRHGKDWPRVLAVWNPDYVATEAELRSAALAMDAWLQSH